eukprot:scaffold1466_cov385-Prasinococcus_capsulatus_cf.AAC.2
MLDRVGMVCRLRDSFVLAELLGCPTRPCAARQDPHLLTWCPEKAASLTETIVPGHPTPRRWRPRPTPQAQMASGQLLPSLLFLLGAGGASSSADSNAGSAAGLETLFTSLSSLVHLDKEDAVPLHCFTLDALHGRASRAGAGDCTGKRKSQPCPGWRAHY